MALWTSPSNAGAQVESLVRELRSTCFAAKKPKHKTRNIVTNSITIKIKIPDFDSTYRVWALEICVLRKLPKKF